MIAPRLASFNMKKTTMTHQVGLSRHFPLLLLLLCLVAWSCKPTSVFLEPARLALVENNVELRSVQIYNDKAIIMRIKSDSLEVSQSGGKLMMVDGEQVIEFVIKAGTPGVITGTQNGKFLVRFESGKDKILQFYKNTKGAFQIDSAKWIGQRGLVKYAGLTFMLEAESNDVILMYKEQKRFRSASKSRTLKGLKVPKQQIRR
jgi:hypothetical protein